MSNQSGIGIKREGSKHTIMIRDVDEELYIALWNLRRHLKAKDWKDMLRKIIELWREEWRWM